MLPSGGTWPSCGEPTLLEQTKKQLANSNGSCPLCRYPTRHGGTASLKSMLLSYCEVTSSRSEAWEDKRRMRRKSQSMPSSFQGSKHSLISALRAETLAQTRRHTPWVHWLWSQQAHMGSVTIHRLVWGGDKCICA